ncbi:non-ribosomal peptide synthetase [Streptomyces spectabilis]|uniref:non-ribosomal peptide synthetase n=1 Tax=Streptomyces spectabilis TaxID=68270 RepID=UPI00137808FE|nr:non-ribosomal peptide synthetase [Streptomyces spectabilis]
MKHELSALIADYKAGRVGAHEVGDLLRDLRAQAGEPQPQGVSEYPLSEGQRGLWALQRAYPDMTAYNVPLCFRVSGLDATAFQDACRALLVRHPVLTTVIGQDEGEPTQSVDPARALDFARVDLTGTADEGEALAVVERAGKRVFSLGGAAGHDGDGLFRVRVFDRPAGESLVLLVVHHIVFDGTSATLLMNTLFEEYEARVHGTVAEGRGAEDTAGFCDFVREERRTLAARGAERLPYWHRRLAAPLPVLDLPAERPHTALADRFAGKTLVTEVSAELAARVAEFAAARRTFVSTAMLTAYAATLATYSDAGELVVGMPVNERDGDALARTVGLMINMVPVRVALPPDEPFDRLVERAQRDVADDLLHGYPFPALVRELAQDTPAGRSPVFQTAFVFQDVLDGIADADRPYRLVEELHQEGEYELSVEVWRSGAGYALYWKYQPELYRHAFIEELAARFTDVLAAVCEDPCTTVAALRRPGGERCVQDLVEDTARRTPDAVAVAGQEEVLTYEALSARSDALASCLVARGVRRGDLVSVLLDRSPDLVATLLGILKAGAAYVPLDPELPAARLTDIVTDSGTPLIVTQARHEARARGLAEGRGAAAPALFVLDEERDALAAALAAGRPAAVPVTADDLAYVIYTSGSTGRPKGVMIPHRGFTNLLGSLRREPGMDATDTLFAVTTVSFDMAQVELLLPLVCGARVHVCDSPTIKDVDRLKERLARVRPTVMQATPATWSMLFHSGWRNPEGVRVFCGGEALPRTLKDFFRDTGTEAWNLYGPTETTVYSTGGLVRHDRPTTIGRPVAHTRVHILDERLRPVPHGETGELCIAGKGLAKGYVNRPDLTAEKFVDHDLVPGGKLYRTGDLARWTEDGEIDYLGRKDFQVKIRGYRIELGDIEYHLGRHQDVAECVVVARGEDGAKQLVAYYVPRGGGARADAFKEHLRALLPAYMVPDFYVPLDAVPLTGSGKVDRTALMRREVSAAPVPAAAPAPPSRPKAAAQPSRDVEREVLACWQEVLKVGDLTPSVSFFESGGNSLSAVVLADLISRRLGVPFAAADLFKYATAAAVAAYVRERTPDAAADAAPDAAVTTEPVAPAPAHEPEPGSGSGSEQASLPDDAVAVVGISCRFPDARDHWEFWENLKNGHASAGRWSEADLRAAGVPERVIGDPDFVPLRSGLDGKEEFDGAFFRLSPQHVELMDPQFRQVLLHAWKAVEDAGRDHREIPNTGVYVSTGNHHYGAPDDTSETPAAVIEDPRQYLSWVMSQSGTVASMVSYQLGFGGPSMSVHSNCSSSLSALALAARAVQTGETDFALVAAASANSVDGLGYVHKAGLNLSGDGRVKAFDADADGMAGGEGVVALLIRRAADAVADGDHVYGLLRGIAVNNDGGDATGFYSPSVNGQSRLIRQVLDRTGVDPRTIGYVEAHGTGTKLGDPVEVAALTEAYRAFTDDTGYCGIGSVKTNLGHLDTAAGLTGAVKVLLSLYHGQLPPTLHYREPNPQLRLDTSPFHVVDRLRDWPAGTGPRRAAQSSIGLGGTNAHAVFEEYVPAAPARPDGEGAPELVPLSARTRDDLVRAAAELHRHLTGPRATALRLDDVAHTLRTGRVAMAHRVAFVVRDLDRLAAELDAFVRDPDGDDTARRFTGPAAGCAPADGDAARKHTARLARKLADGRLKKAAKAWARGADADWSPLTGQRAARRVSLPGYAFAPVPHPYPARTPRGAAPRPDATPGTAPAHPLLHENVSRLDGQRYRSAFSGDEYVLHDHVVDGKKLLPAVASLEMACAAVRQALPETAGRRTVLKNVTWARPVVVDEGGRQVEFTLTRETAASSGALGFALLTDGDQLCVQGRATTEAAAPPPRVDLAELRDRLRLRPLPGDDVYAHIARAGVAYGPGFRLVHVLYRGERDGRREALAELRLPAHLRATADAYALHPSFLDAAVHASLGLDPAFDSADPSTAGTVADGTTRVPFALDRLDAHAPFGETMYAWVRPAANRSAAAERVLDIDLLDPAGRVCATLRGLAYRALAAAPDRREPARAEAARASELRTLLPVWEPRHPAEAPATDSPRGTVLVLDADGRLRAELAALHPGHQRVDLPDGASVDDIAGLIRAACAATDGRIARIVWVAPAESPDGMVRGQERGAVEVFRTVKALLALGHGTRDLAWSLYTFGTQPVRDADPVAATHASVHGLAGSLAQEHTRWTIDVADLPHPDSGDRVGDRLGEERHLTGVRPGTTVALRGGRWFSHELLPTTAPEPATGTYRHGGVYVVIGGAGGIGELWSRYMVDRYRATIVWIGRSPLADGVEERLADLAERARAAGAAAPSYVRADARDHASLRAAHTRIKRDHPRVDGVVHSAIVLADKTLAHMDEDRFRAALASKVDVGVRVADVFAAEPLDFLLFFSSVESFVRAPGQANYAAGCTFKDALAHALNRRGATVAKAVNWGYWGVAGVVSDSFYRERMAAAGVDSLDPDEAFAALESFLAGEHGQIALMRTFGDEALRGLALDEHQGRHRPGLPSVRDAVVSAHRAPHGEVERLRRFLPHPRMRELTLHLLYVTLRDLGAARPDEAGHRVLPRYARWLEESHRLFAEAGPALAARDLDGAALWRQWRAERDGWQAGANQRAQADLVESCLEALPDVLTGARQGTEILFPGSSLSRVEGVYRGDPVVDYFNDRLSVLLADAVRAWCAAEPARRLRVLEVGAGTGATSVKVLQALEPFGDRIAEYHYTDLSKAFLFRAEERLKPRYPHVTTGIFNAEHAPGPQGVDLGGFDVVVATNVLHATADISRTLRNVKATLRPGGLLLLNEMSRNTLLAHVTFGLVDGWWRYRDAALRIPGSPVLSAESWREVLEDEGFRTGPQPDTEAHALGQMLLVAESDGRFRTTDGPSSAQAPAAPRSTAPDTAYEPVAAGPARDDEGELRARTADYFERLLREALHLADGELDPAEDLHDYGLDSILVSGMNSAVARDFEDVSSTLFFELRTLDDLVDHFVERRRPELRTLFGLDGTGARGPRDEVARSSGASLTERAVAYVTGLVAETLKLDPEGFDADADLFDLGLDSILVVQLNNTLGRDFEDLSSTLFFDHATVRDVAAYFAQTHTARLAEVLGTATPAALPLEDARPAPASAEARPAPESRREPERHSGDIAVVGLAGRYPGAESPARLWENLARGESATAPYPADRWWCDWQDRERPWGGFLADVASFDAEYFGIDEREAAAMDPQERLFIETAHGAVQDAGYTPAALAGQGRVGVFVGVMNATYNGRTAYSSIANRTSYLFDFQGPSVAVDTACSGSLTALHLAVQSLLSGDSACAVAGGVNLLLGTDHFDVLQEHGLLSSGERCRPFSEHADGFLAAEGVGAVVLRPLRDAEAAGDHVYGVIKGSAVNSGGRTSRYSMPSLDAQRDVVSHALARAGVTADTISYVEAHGTATPLGDSLEISALGRAFAGDRPGQYCAVGSLKSNLGHCESASGVAGLTKVLMQLRHRALAPSINAEDLNTGIVFKQSPFHVQRELAPWNPVDADGRPLPRRAGISCFGAGGSNAHLIIEGYENMADDEARHTGAAADEAFLVPLSARTPERLRTAAGELAAHLGEAAREGRPMPLRDIAHTLRTGRDELPVRLALVVRSTAELAAALAEFSERGGAGPDRYADLTGTGARPAAAAGEAGDPHAAARAWLTGASVARAEPPTGRPPRRVSLPTYPFARRDHWYESAGNERPEPEEPAREKRPEPRPEPRLEGAAADVRAWLCAALAEELDGTPHDVATDREFAALGVSSMGLVRLSRRVRSELHADFASAALFEHRTVDALAAHLGGVLPRVVQNPDEADERDEFVPHPLSEGQRGLWSLQKSAPGASVYHVPLCFEVSGLDLRALHTAFDAVRTRHPLLGAVVRRDGDQLVFARAEAARPAVTEHELTATDPDEVRAQLRAHAREPFDLENGPLCRLSVFRGAHGTDARVLLNAHHLVLDGASAVVLVKELLAAYRSAAAGAAPLPAPACAPYAEFVADEAALLAGDEGTARLAYWRDQLAALPPVPAFPTDRPRSAPEQGLHGATEVLRLPVDLGDRVARFARERGVYPSAVFLAAHKVLLRQYTQQDDLVVGMPVSTRPSGRFDGTVGHFVTMVPVRSRMSGRSTFAELCADVQGTLLDALAHAHPFGPLVRELGLGTADGSTPVFRHAFMYQDWHEDVTAGAPDVRHVEGIHQEGEYELVIEVIEPHAAEDAYTVKAKYDPALFDAVSVDRLLRQYAHLLESAPATDPDRRLDDCSAASPQELHTLTVEWNDTAVAQPERCVHELFADQAARTPDAVALATDTESVTYARLDERIRQLAARLRRLGVGPGRLVAVHLERSVDLVVALLATLRAGGAYIPLDPDYPRERVAHILDDAEPAVLLTHTALRGRSADLDRPGQRLLVLDDPGADPTAEAPSDGTAPGADDPAYVIYTSGSTGLPKGVVVPHRALTNFLCAMAKRPGLGAADRILAVTTHSFDIAALELYLPLVTGAECHLSDPATARSGDRLAALIARVRPTVMQATPATWTMLLHAGWTNAEGLRVLCGGEALSESLAERLTALGGEVWNLFGPTETTVWSTVARVEAGRRVTIGRPIDNTRIHILDKNGDTAPIGVPGELCVAGDGLALGYLNRPELTAERFPADPFTPGGRLYRTGDLARRLADGSIECLGRIDSQVKVRGFRVELGEIEHALTRHPAVRECAVVTRAEPATGATQLIAYWTGEDATARELTEHLRRTLPAYMVPAFVLPLDRLPQTPNGKVDRLALARRPIALPDAPAASERSAAPDAARPRDGAPPRAVAAVRDSDVLAVWRDVLGVAGLRPTDAFLDAGGNSVLAVVLADRVAERFGARFTSADVFGCVDAAGTAARLRADLGADLGAEHRPGAVAHAEQTAQAAPELPAGLEGTVAVIGVSVGLPGADDHRAFWRNLVAGTESVELCTPDELRRLGVDERLIQDPAHVPVRASMRGKGLFDHAFFQVSARDAELMDPQARQLLQHAWKAVEDAAYLPDDIADAAVYMSTANSLYQAPVTGPGARRDSEALVGFLQAQPGTVPTTVSHRLGLRGPSLFVHSNCSSALAGLALACQGIQSGQTTHALVGGSAMYGEETVGYLYEEGMTLSPDGHCKPFAADARGMVGGEGTVVVLLKDARAAVRDGDHIHALVRGVGMNNDGARKAGYYAPSHTGQSELIASVLDRAGVRAESVRYLEAHGTGTVIGDPVEVNAVSEAFRLHTRATGFCGIGSVKANLGHLDAAAGLAGLVKSALVLSHRTVPPTINHDAPNPQIDFANSPFQVVDRLTPLTPADAQPLRAAVSSFGIGGTNVHAVLEEAPPREGRGADVPGPHLVPLSARTPDALRRYARDLARHLTDEQDAADLADVAFTFQVGRTAMPCRAAFVAATTAELVAALEDFAERARPGVQPSAQASAQVPGALGVLDEDDRRALLDQWLAERRLDKAARLWEAGEPVDWRRLYADGPRPRRLSLPAYPFDGQHFWLRAEPPAPVADDVVAPHLFEERWVARAAAAVADTDARRVVVAFLSDRAAQDAYRAATLRHAPGTRLVFVARTGTPEPAPVDTGAELPVYRVDTADERALARVLVAVAEAHGPVDALHYLWPTECAAGRPPLRELADVGVLVRAVAATGGTVPDILVAGHYDDAVGQAALDALIGYERSLAGPLPGTALRVVLHEGAATAGRWAELLLTEQQQEQQAAALYRGGQRHVCAVRSLPGAAAHAPGVLREGGTYLITGAFGGLGRRVAGHLARAYRANLVLLGRSPLSPADETWAAGLGEHGGAVVCRRADVTDEDALVEALSTLPPALRAIDGVVHAAGTAQRLAVTDATREAARRVLAAKVDGTLALERALARTRAGRSAEFICLFSSSSATLGDFGSCDYAVANRFQSAYARALAERGERRLLAVAWPLWEDGGMGAAAQRAADHDHVTAYLAASGQRPLAADTALALLERLLAERPRSAAPLVLHAPAERALALAERPFAAAPRGSRPAVAAARPQDPAPARETAVAHDRRRAALADAVREVVAHVLKSPVDQLDDDGGFHDLGLDSIRLTQLAHRLAERLGTPLQPTVLYDHPSVRRLTDHLADETGVRLPEPAMAPAAPQRAPEVTRTHSRSGTDSGTGTGTRTGTDAIAVIGMSGIFPGCRDVDAFWSALADGKDLVRELPSARFGAAATRDEGAPLPYRWMGSIDWADEFDAAFFEIAPKEARALDPRQRHLLQECWKALEDAALGAQELEGLKVGVFVGVEQGDYQLLDGAGGNLTSNHDGVLAARLSYFLDLKGPVLAVNTSCSSGLVALHQARAGLLQGECDIAVVAAANFVLTPQALAAMSDAGMLSASGRCATFDQDADGMVPGEAVTALVLRPLAAAETAGDPVHSVITASGLNYDGRTNGITAPSGDAQRELLESVYERGGIDPADIGYVVTHGTGTKLGDPVEVGALRAAFARHTDERGFCALTSTKTNVGHTFAASGLVGLVCLSEALRHRAIPPSLHCERDNEYIDWSASPFYVNKATKEWPAPRHGHRTGAVSAFGMSGTNAHVVVREYTGRPATAAPTRSAYLLPVSAKTQTALEGIVDALLDRIASGALKDADLPRLSATLVTGRHHFRHRCALVVSSLEEAAALWRAWRRSRTAAADACFEGVVPRGFTERAQDRDRLRAAADSARDTGLDPAARRAALVEVARGYIAGHRVPTAVARPDGQRVTRLRLPAYPFARNRYWVRAEQQAPAPAVTASAEQGPAPVVPASPVSPAASAASAEPRKPVVLRDLADVPHRIDSSDALPGTTKPQVSLAPLTSAPHRPETAPEAPEARPVTRDHDVLEDLKAAASLDFGGMVATLNRTGVMVERLIPYSQEFAAYAGESGGEALDLGCAYGVASIAALERGARVVALDMEQKHLDILGQRVNDEARQRLSLRQGMLPDVDFEAGRFTAVHASRVMHFLAPDDFRLTLRKMHDWLVPGGKVFLSSDSPYFGYWASKAADYEARKSAGDPWPGYIDDVAAHFEAAHVVGGPPLINAIDPDVFRRECEAAGFVVEQVGYFGAVGVDRESYGAPAPDMEHVGVIARKPDEPAAASAAAVTTATTATKATTATTATSADGNRIRYRVRGSGPTALVLIHGLGCDASYWDRQLAHFADRCTVVALDLAGHGGSGGTRQKWTVEAFAEDVVAVVEQEGLDDVVLVGHSLGGPVMLAAERLLGGRVRGLVGVDTLHDFEPKALSAEQLDRFVRTFSEQPVEARELFLDGARDDLVALVARTREETGAAVVSAAFREMLTYLQDVPKHFDVPLVLINSTSWMPTNLTAARRYGVEVELVDGVGHFVMLEAPLTFNAILRRHLEQIAPGVVAGQDSSGPSASAEGADS